MYISESQCIDSLCREGTDTPISPNTKPWTQATLYVLFRHIETEVANGVFILHDRCLSTVRMNVYTLLEQYSYTYIDSPTYIDTHLLKQEYKCMYKLLL